MSERKNIDRLFQEKFKDFEAIPPKNAWSNILSELDGEKKKRKFIAPFWLKLSGIAAVFLLGFLTATYFISQPGKNENTPLVNTNSNQSTNENENTGSNPNIIKKEILPTATQNAVVENDRYTEKGSTTGNNTSGASATTAASSVKKQNGNANSYKDKVTNKKYKNRLAVTNGNAQNGYDADTDKRFADRTNNNDGNSKNSGRFKSFNFPKKNNIANYIVMPKKDSTEIAKVEEQENALEKIQKEKFIIAEKKKDKEKELKKSRWAVSTMAAPIFFRSTSNGSPIDNQLASNAKDYENTASYGVGLRYELNDKLTLRTGINRLAFEYNTNDIVYYESANARSLQNVNQSRNASNIQIQSKDAGMIGSNGEIIDKKSSGTLSQRMGYIEVPMELSYKLVDNKFGIELIGGFSTLFLNQNKIDLVSQQLNTTIGEASNLNNVHLSSNIGVGIKYRFLKSFEANFEPTFKYQLNMFSSDPGNFKPYLFGLYTGVSYRF